MTFYKLLNISVYRDNSLRYRIRYNHDIVHVIRTGDDYIVEEWGQLMAPLFDSCSEKIVGFIEA